jgi:hypothetical protein
MLFNHVKVFVLKFFHNTLGLNTRVSHFVDNYLRICELCKAKSAIAMAEETFTHLFAECPVANLWRKNWLREFFNKGDIPEASVTWKKVWLLGELAGESECNIFIRTLILTFQYTIWECKLQHKAPSYHTVRTRFVYLYEDMLKLNRSVLEEITNNNYPICRTLAARGPWRAAPRRP